MKKVRNKKGKNGVVCRTPVDLSGLDFICENSQLDQYVSQGLKGPFSTLQVEFPSRRWLRQATSGSHAKPC